MAETEYELAIVPTPTDTLSGRFSDEDIVDILTKCYVGGRKAPSQVTQAESAKLLRKYGIDPDELVEKMCYRKGEQKKDANGNPVVDNEGKKVFAGVGTIQKVKRYRNPAQILGGVKMEALRRANSGNATVRQALLQAQIIRPKPGTEQDVEAFMREVEEFVPPPIVDSGVIQ
jgi:hypothetical protein